jgi:hypothetical protein
VAVGQLKPGPTGQITAPGQTDHPPKLTHDDIEAAKAMLANTDIGVTQIRIRQDHIGIRVAAV